MYVVCLAPSRRRLILIKFKAPDIPDVDEVKPAFGKKRADGHFWITLHVPTYNAQVIHNIMETSDIIMETSDIIMCQFGCFHFSFKIKHKLILILTKLFLNSTIFVHKFEIYSNLIVLKTNNLRYGQ